MNLIAEYFSTILEFKGDLNYSTTEWDLITKLQNRASFQEVKKSGKSATEKTTKSRKS